MSKFNEYNWKEALIAVYTRAISDATYRNLCVADPAAAIKEVSDIELPPDLKVQFYSSKEEYVYSYLLPPAADPITIPDSEITQLIRWNVLCTVDPTTH